MKEQIFIDGIFHCFGVDDECPGQGLDSGEAIKRAKSRRPIIEPIGDFR